MDEATGGPAPDREEMAEGPAPIHAFRCGGCGASLEYAPGEQALACPYCGSRRVLEEEGERRVAEYDFTGGVRQARRARASALVQGGREVACTGCGARTVVAGQAGHCPYCGGPVVLAVEAETGGAGELFLPESVLPFHVAREAAEQAFRAWLRGLWFAPGDLARQAASRPLDGVYMPYWTYDAEATTRYRGQRGEHYWVTETRRDSQGHTHTHRTRKTRWYSASGTVHDSFDDVLVYASKSLPRDLVEGLEPWDLAALAPYRPEFLSGFTAERYAIGLEQGFRLAQGRMEPDIRAHVRRDIGGDEQRIHAIDVDYADVAFKHFLLPLWISAFRYRDKVYRFLVNARTGEVAGERPWSWFKIALAVLAAAAIIAAAVAATQR